MPYQLVSLGHFSHEDCSNTETLFSQAFTGINSRNGQVPLKCYTNSFYECAICLRSSGYTVMGIIEIDRYSLSLPKGVFWIKQKLKISTRNKLFVKCA